MKTQIITLAAVLLLAMNVSAKTTSTLNTDGVSVGEISNTAFVLEETLTIENWMTNDYVWNLASTNVKVDEVNDEESLQLAGWMTNSEQWMQNANKKFSIQANFESDEEPLSIEGWMTNDESWSL